MDSQGNVYVAFGTGDATASPSLYFGGVAKFSGFGPVTGDWNGDGIVTQQIVHAFAGGNNGAYAKHAEVTVPSLADWEKDWQENPQRNTQPKLLAVDCRSAVTAIAQSN